MLLNGFVNRGTDDEILKSLPIEEIPEDLVKAMGRQGLVQKDVTVKGKNGQTFTRKQWVRASEAQSDNKPKAVQSDSNKDSLLPPRQDVMELNKLYGMTKESDPAKVSQKLKAYADEMGITANGGSIVYEKNTIVMKTSDGSSVKAYKANPSGQGGSILSQGKAGAFLTSRGKTSDVKVIDKMRKQADKSAPVDKNQPDTKKSPTTQPAGDSGSSSDGISFGEDNTEDISLSEFLEDVDEDSDIAAACKEAGLSDGVIVSSDTVDDPDDISKFLQGAKKVKSIGDGTDVYEKNGKKMVYHSENGSEAIYMDKSSLNGGSDNSTENAGKGSDDSFASPGGSSEPKQTIVGMLTSGKSRDDIMSHYEAAGVTWKHNDHPAINWMRANMAIQKHLKGESGSTPTDAGSGKNKIEDKSTDTKSEDKNTSTDDMAEGEKVKDTPMQGTANVKELMNIHSIATGSDMSDLDGINKQLKSYADKSGITANGGTLEMDKKGGVYMKASNGESHKIFQKNTEGKGGIILSEKAAGNFVSSRGKTFDSRAVSTLQRQGNYDDNGLPKVKKIMDENQFPAQMSADGKTINVSYPDGHAFAGGTQFKAKMSKKVPTGPNASYGGDLKVGDKTYMMYMNKNTGKWSATPRED